MEPMATPSWSVRSAPRPARRFRVFLQCGLAAAAAAMIVVAILGGRYLVTHSPDHGIPHAPIARLPGAGRPAVAAPTPTPTPTPTPIARLPGAEGPAVAAPTPP